MAIADNVSAPRKPRSVNRAKRRSRTFYAFITPWLLGLIFLTLIPLIFGFVISLTNYDGLNLFNAKFMGLQNYTRAFSDEYVSLSLGRTLIWTALNLPLWMGLSFVLALILNQDVKGRGFFRTLYYLPNVVPAVAGVTIWKVLLDQNNGLLNGVINFFQPGIAVGWLTTYALQGMTVIAVWSGLGYGMVIFLAGLQNIPDELVEAAKIDGANAWQVFRHITLPLMTPVIFFQLIMGLIGSFQQLVYPLLLGTGSSGTMSYTTPRSIYLYMIKTYSEIFTNQRYGYGTALLWLLTIGVTALTLFVFWSQKFWVYSGDTPETGGSS
jgi:multiple sugar transport system permease protein